jgi:glycosyltransferase involved in cell wall biosynthesis
MRNVEKWVEKTINSVKEQKEQNYICAIVDDFSTDQTYEKVKKLTQNDPRFIVTKNNERKYAMKNRIKAIDMCSPDNEDVVVTIDGDDWLTNSNVLTRIRNLYEKKDCLITYGSYILYPSGLIGDTCFKYSDDVIKNNTYRETKWGAAQLRTFKYKLWKKINIDDFKDVNGNYLKMTGDMAFMFPLLEMAGERQEFISDPLYVYNLKNPINDHKIDNSYQISLEKYIRGKKRYGRYNE